MKILGIIPARGGSKGIPRKNLTPLLGRPLLAYTAEAALNAQSLNRVVLSTDDREIAEVGRHLRLEVPFMRPASLAQDDTPTIAVVQHVLKANSIAEMQFDAVCILQPTAPLRTADMIDAACSEFVDSGVDTLVSVTPTPHHYHPDWALVTTPQGTLRWASGQAEPPARRQNLSPTFHRDGSIYITRTTVIRETHSLYGRTMRGFEIDPEFHVNIDGPADTIRAERMLHTLMSDASADQK